MTQPSDLPLPAADALQAQLFRYAQDMDALMQQHNRLLTHHQMVLQSIGREFPTAELLPMLLCESTALQMTTDSSGSVLRASAPMQSLVEPHTGRLQGRRLQDCVIPAHAAQADKAIELLTQQTATAGGVLFSLAFCFSGPDQGQTTLDTLVMQMRQGHGSELHWFFSPPQPARTQTAVLTGFLRNVKADHGLMLTDPFGTILMVNPHFEAICGYSAAELVGNNPRMLSSGRHSGSFYQDFWIEMLERGSWSGTIFNRRKGGQIFLEWQAIRMVENIDGQVLAYLSAITDLTQADKPDARLSQLAYQDPLTGLANRRLLMETFNNSLNVCKKDRTELSVLFIDLDRFKPINDQFGHEVGDLVLSEAARRIREALQPSDFLARVGGDEFVVLLAGTERARQAQTTGLDLLTGLRAPIQAGPHTVSVGASIGCARFPHDSGDLVTLLNQADRAMYATKRNGAQFGYFDPEKSVLPQVNMDFELWHALERGHLHLLYQPQLRSGRLRGCEVLVRWTHPQLGQVDPHTFVPLAEKNGAIVGIGQWVIDQACQQLRHWMDGGMHEIILSVNVSLRQLRDPGFAKAVQKSLSDSAVPPRLLELEFSEADTLLLRQDDLTHIKVLREMGVGMAIDDFGTSFSGLSRLSALKISGLKINPCFVQELMQSQDAQNISRCLVAIGQALNIEVIALGVESESQAQLLAEQGCQVIQGYYAGMPVPADELSQQFAPSLP